MSLVSCAKVGEALTEWLETASQLKKTELCQALGCGPTDAEIAGVFMTCEGIAHIPGTSIPSCEEMDEAITEAIAAIFTGGTEGQVWTKRADNTQGWEANALPESTSVNENQILTVDENGNPVWANPVEELPASTPDESGKVLTVGPTGSPQWAIPPTPGTLTEVKTIDTQSYEFLPEDNGKLLVIVATFSERFVTIPAGLPIGWRVDLIGQVQVQNSPGITIESIDNKTSVVSLGGASIVNLGDLDESGTDVFWLVGALE